MRALLCLMVLAACSGARDRPAAEAAPADLAHTTFAPSLGVDVASLTKTPRGAYVRDLAPGSGEPVAAGQQVAIHYQGSLPNGQQFDANGSNDPPFVFRIGAGEVVPGFDEGVTGMRVGGKRLVVIPPELGYGSQPNGPIPANSILVFTIELVSVR
jgi:FKBP-type peptidyl-prolyl cis-trans isomerase FkpA